nr:FHA domain-containing protein [Auraticoccus cholistanensis]
MVYCHQCGHANPEDANFCARCGERLARLEPASPQESRGSGSGDTTTTGIPVIKDDVDASELNDSERAAVAALPAGSALLVVRSGPGSGSRYLIDADEMTIGRHPSSDIFLDDITVSRHHVTLTRQGEQVMVHDSGSLNGTYVNRARIEGSVALNPGDVLQIGKFRMVYHPSPRGLS